MITLIKYFFRLFLWVGLAIIIASTGCKCKSKNKLQSNMADSLNVPGVDEKLISEISTAKKIFYSLPSPLETALIIKKAGATFNPDILNSTNNVSNYVSNKSMALNLGIYSTDLSYASLFDQTQYSIQYMNAAKKMVEGLGITDAITNETIQKLQDNLNRRDVIMDIISEAFMNSSSFLRDNHRSSISCLVLVGGWIEGLYLAIRLVDKTHIIGNDLLDRIVDQKISLINVMQLMEENKNDPDVASVLVLMNDLKSVFDEVKIKTTANKTELDTKSNVTKIKSKSEVKIDEALILKLDEKIKYIRNNFTL